MVQLPHYIGAIPELGPITTTTNNNNNNNDNNNKNNKC